MQACLRRDGNAGVGILGRPSKLDDNRRFCRDVRQKKSEFCFLSQPHPDGQYWCGTGFHNMLANEAPVTFVKGVNPPAVLHITSSTARAAQLSRLLEDLDEFEGYEDDWDGEGAKAPDLSCMILARNFIKLLKEDWELPDLSISGGEGVSLYWRSGEYSLIVGFRKDNRVSFYFRAKEERCHGDNMGFNGTAIPPAVKIAIEAFNRYSWGE